MTFPETWLDELLEKNDIVSVIAPYVELKPKGKRLWGLCPLHGEKTPSFSVSPDKQMFYCFGCHAGGTAIQFIMQVNHYTFLEAVQYLAEQSGMELPHLSDDSAIQKEKAHKEAILNACNLAARFYMETLIGEDGVPGRTYLSKRRLSSESIKRFGIGYAKDGWDNLKIHLNNAGFSDQVLIDAGLLVRNSKTGKVYDAYRNRIIFPIIGLNQKVIGFGARVLDDSKPKYINTGDTPVYNKRYNLYGLNLLHGNQLKYVYIVEGYMDVIGLFEQGVENAVASLGTALTVQQAKLLKRFVSTVYIAYDGDSAGQNATLRGMEILRDEGLDVRVIVFPDNLDPDEYIRNKGREEFEKLKDNALSLSSFKLTSFSRKYNLEILSEREQFAMESCNYISELQPVQRVAAFKQVSLLSGYSVEELQNQVLNGSKNENTFTSSRLNKTGERRHDLIAKESANRAEDLLVHCVSIDDKAMRFAVQKNFEQYISNPAYLQLIEELKRSNGDGSKRLSLIISQMEQENAKTVTAMLNEELPNPDPVKIASDCINRLKNEKQKSILKELKEQLSDTSLSTERKNEILVKINELNIEVRNAAKGV